MTIRISDVSLDDALRIIERRVNRLAMCKRGAVETDINRQTEALGKRPEYTAKERKDIKKKLAGKVVKAMTPTVAMFKKYNGSLHSLANHLIDQGEKEMEELKQHPDAPAWDRKMNQLNQQKTERLAVLDADFQDVIDQFTLCEKKLEDLPSVLMELEQKEW